MIYDAARSTAVVFDLSARGKIAASGTEAAMFLHNLATNDIKTLSPSKGCEAFFCTATAKVVGHGWIWRLPSEGKRDRFWLDLDPGLAEKMYAHLDRHLISEDVTLTDHTPTMAQLHVTGPRAAEALTAAGLGDGREIERVGLPGFDLLCALSEASALRDRLRNAGVVEGDPVTFDVLRVEAGIPLYGVDMDETTFAAEVGRTKQAISYNKGCYLGQEPIVMARDRGVVQRTMVGLLLNEVVPPGSLLYRDSKEVGRTASCFRSPRFGAIALAYLRRGSQAAGTVVEVEVAGNRRQAKVTGLPFA